MLIRNPTLFDSNDILDWRNDKKSRLMFFDSSVVKKKDQETWFAKAVIDKNVKMFIGIVKKNKIGICRFNIKENNKFAEVSINMNPFFRGKGLAKNFLKLSILKFRENNNINLIAKVKIKNTLSQNFFRAVGFYQFSLTPSLITFLLSKQTLSFKKIVTQDAVVLYDLLKLRQHNISHSTLPSFFEHKKFIKNNPYLYWYLVMTDKPIGSFYIQSDNSIGMNIINPNENIINETLFYIKNNFKPKKPILSLVPSYFYINVASTNTEIGDLLSRINLDLIQFSYKVN